MSMEIKDIRNQVSTTFGDWYERFGDLWKSQIAQLKEKFGSVVEEVRSQPEFPVDVPVVYVNSEKIVEVLRFFRDDLKYQFLSDLTATDESPAQHRFELVYNLFSHTSFSRIRVKARLREEQDIPSVISVWAGANWAEREVFDMFGVKFRGHPDLRRILMDHRWVGHPLRKDYPLRGYQVFPTPEPIDPELLK